TLRDGQQVTARMVIDTGAVGSIAYFSRTFATKARLAERSLASVPDTMGRTACRIGRFSLGAMGIDRPVVHYFGNSGLRRQNRAGRHDRGGLPSLLPRLPRLYARPYDPGTGPRARRATRVRCQRPARSPHPQRPRSFSHL